MKRTMCYIPILTFSTLLWSLVCVISKPLLLSAAANQQAFFKVDSTNRIQDVQRPFDSTQGEKVMMEYEEALRGVGSRIGSTPPRCEHKCGGCIPCNPTQKPTNKHLIGVQYANYEPEGWKCMCGTSYFNP
ncbi:EPIDERMAL PATTERNING FACTOR-like protein 5 isoform X2 [Medicago truncatula]|uniref:EPIDERMAL PATTERNING FACTOR-like protein 5 isoform X2 n=1 Tax=Medicago truncatula TaxID=3880 RepID=UPI0019683D1B|nr:EPIDERMAL PATTERNING FACTOR-like protein 5 isoform X2 [Medicago truncatula]